jgi:hypothetical protein
MGGNKQHKKQGKSGNKPKHTSGAAGGSASDAKKPVTIDDISAEFQTIILDFLRDIDCSFPEYHETLAKYLGYSHEMKPMPDELYIELYTHCKEVYPVRFFDILYKNEASLFAAATETDDDAKAVFFLPSVDFRDIWATEDIADNTKDIIWKYLQLILFSIVNNLSDMGSFGDTAKLFEAIDDNELKTKLEEVIGEMGSMFGGGPNDGSTPNSHSHQNMDETFKKATEFMSQAFEGSQQTSGGAPTGPAPSSVPDASSIHEHLSGILNGKIGKLAKEIAEETAADLNLDMENETSMKGVFQQLLKNPSKLSGIIKTVGSKLDSKLKSGELKESEIMQEASELMSKMKNMPGMNNLASMLSKMGMNMPGMGGGAGGGGKVNFGAMQSQLNKNMKQAQMRERLLKKVQEKQAATAAMAATAAAASGATTAVFTSGEKPAKTPRVQGQAQAASAASTTPTHKAASATPTHTAASAGSAAASAATPAAATPAAATPAASAPVEKQKCD